MFKSVFAKYVCAFMLIILFCFSVIIAIVTSIVMNYSVKTKAELVQNSAEATAKYFSEQLKSETDVLCFGDHTASNKESVSSVISIIASSNDDMTLFITDSEGVILLSEGNEQHLIESGAHIPEDVMERLVSAGSLSENTDLDGIYASKRMIYAVPVFNGEAEAVGAVFVCASSVIMTELLSDISRATVMSILWVMLAALVAVYIVTQRIIALPAKFFTTVRQTVSVADHNKSCHIFK